MLNCCWQVLTVESWWARWLLVLPVLKHLALRQWCVGTMCTKTYLPGLQLLGTDILQERARKLQGSPCCGSCESTSYHCVKKKKNFMCALNVLQWGGTIRCQVIAPRHYSRDLPHGGLEIPCMLTFEGNAEDIAKGRKLVKYPLISSPEAATKDEPLRYDNSTNGTEDIITGRNFLIFILVTLTDDWSSWSELEQVALHAAFSRHTARFVTISQTT